MIKKRLFLALILLLVSLSLFAENFYITDYDVDIDVALNRVYTVKENLTLNYTTPSHGFFRDIPIRYEHLDNMEARVNVLSVNAPYEIEEGYEYLSIRIGDADELVSGPVSYEIVYTYDLGADIYPDYDEFYFNIISSAWMCDIENVDFSVHFPKNIRGENIYLTSGSFGREVNAVGAEYVFNGTDTVVGLVDHLSMNEPLTLRVEMEEGFFVGAYEKPDYTYISLSVIIVSFIVVLCLLVYLYRRYGVDKPLVIFPRFTPPENITPLDAGYLYDESADEKDFTSMIFYWADKGLIEIHEEKKNEFRLKKKDELRGAPAYESELFEALFSKGDDVSIEDIATADFAGKLSSSIKPKLLKRFSKGENAIKDEKAERASTLGFLLILFYAVLSAVMISLNDLGMSLLFLALEAGHTFLCYLLFWKYSKMQNKKANGLKLLFMLAAIVVSAFNFLANLFFAADIISSDSALLVMALLISFGLPVFALLSVVAGKRSEYGQRITEETLGYKDFLEKVEADQLRKLIDEDPQYYYHNLSYAIVFDLEDKWAKKFKGIYMDNASWYYGYSPVTDYLFYSAMARRFRSSYTVSYSKAISSTAGNGQHIGGSFTSSGSSGFAGGGFGGGGGRSW